MLYRKHQVSVLSLDALVAMLVPVMAAAPGSDTPAADLDLMLVSDAALSQPDSPEEKC